MRIHACQLGVTLAALFNFTGLVENLCSLPSNTVVGLIRKLLARFTRAADPAILTSVNWIQWNSDQFGQLRVFAGNVPAIDSVECRVNVVVVEQA